MRKFLLFVILFAVAYTSYSQDFPGYNYSNYQTAGGMLFNPASIAGSRFRVNVNLLSANVAVVNNAYELRKSSVHKIFKEEDLYEEEDYFESRSSGKKHLFFNTDIIGPSFMIDMGRKAGAIGLSSRLRVLGNVKGLENDIFQLIYNSDNSNYFDKLHSQNNLLMDEHAFADFGLTYSRIVWDNASHVIKAGVTAKYVVGLAAASEHIDNLKVEVRKDISADMLKQMQGSISVMYSGNIDRIMNDDFDWNWENIKDAVEKKGSLGIDFGVEYEWYRDGNRTVPETSRRDRMQNALTRYTFKVSASITDIGSIRYAAADNSANYTVSLPTELPSSTLEPDGRDFSDYIDYLKGLGVITEDAGKGKDYKVSLPAMFRANVDFNAYKALYVNAGAALNLLGNSKYGGRYGNYYYLTPRFETKWFSAYSPLSYNSLKQFNWGFGINVGVFFIGSGSILSNLMKSNLTGADIHFGFSVPIFKGLPREKKTVIPPPAPVIDRDSDGISDEFDRCPDVPGMIKYNGCPPPDSDGDGIDDENDKCPQVAGLAKYGGCPIPDSDGDGVNDEEDHCPDIAGYARYGGCPIPDTDGDGVNNEEDKCPEEPGPASNNGCPEIKPEVVEKVNMAAKAIYFATGSDRLLPKSFPALDAVLATLQTYKSAKMDIEGHTDNTGSAALNLNLSDKRAAAVRNYLLSKGVDADRLISKGYGMTKPIADNKTAAGRSKNRRVEIKLHY